MSQVKITRAREELEQMLARAMSPVDLIPELSGAARDSKSLRQKSTIRMMESFDSLADACNIPELTYTQYRDVQRYGDTSVYERSFHERRVKLSAVAMQVLLGNDQYLNLLYDYIWAICEETIWILPQREDLRVDLRTAATAMDLAEITVGMAPKLEERIIKRVRDEIDRRVFTDYLANHGSRELNWWKHQNNWSGVCNGGIGSAFLLLEPDTARLAHALEVVLEGLQAFLDTAFEEDGASGEGMGYWQYGLSNYICFSEMLRIRTGGAIDLMNNDRMREIAHYPLAVILSPGHFFAHSDCYEESPLMPGLISRLAERTGVGKLKGLLAEPASMGGETSRAMSFHTAWRDVLWWDGARPPCPKLGDELQPVSDVGRLVSETPPGASVVLAAKAGHNGVSHNHNDVGSFVLHVDGETYLCDPERGLYDNYNRYGHDNVIFSNSFGHSVPIVGGARQSRGKEFAGQVTRFAPEGREKVFAMELQGAYQVTGLGKVMRSFGLADGELVLEDEFDFTQEGLPVEEAFVTWNKVLVEGSDAYIIGEKHMIQLTIEKPADAAFSLVVLEKESAENNKPVPLKRLSFTIAPAGTKTMARLRAKVLG